VKASADGNWPTIEGSGKRALVSASSSAPSADSSTEPAKVTYEWVSDVVNE
jgi:hypothetical protein